MEKWRILKFFCALFFGAFYCKTQSIIANIQDGIKMATDFLQGVSYGLKKLDVGLKTAQDVADKATKDGPCEFTCGKGEVMKKNNYYKAVPNGCGSYGVQLSAKELPVSEMADCCNYHDICYGTCLSKKDKCDADFEKCLAKTCEKQKRKLGKDGYKNCQVTSKLLHLSTSALGCKAFVDSQKEACQCVKIEL